MMVLLLPVGSCIARLSPYTMSQIFLLGEPKSGEAKTLLIYWDESVRVGVGVPTGRDIARDMTSLGQY